MPGDSWIFKEKDALFGVFPKNSAIKLNGPFYVIFALHTCMYVQIHISSKTLTFYVGYQQFQPLTYSNSILFGKDSRCLGPWNSPLQCRVLWVDRQGLPGNMFFLFPRRQSNFSPWGLWFIHFIPSNHHFSGAYHIKLQGCTSKQP